MADGSLPLMFPAYAEIFLFVMALVVLMTDVFFGEGRRWLIYVLTQIALLGSNAR